MPFTRSQIQALAAPDFDPYEHDTGWFGSSIVKAVGKAAKGAVKGIGKGVSGAAKGVIKGADAVGGAIGKVPVVGGALKGLATLTVSPYAAMVNVAAGQRIDKAVLSNFKTSIGAAKDVAPYVQAVISFVPGIGTGISGAISGGLALASGQPITAAVLAAAKGALPGGPLAAAAFDVAAAAAQGKPVSDVMLAAVPLPAAQKDIIRQTLAVAKDIANGKSISKIALDRVNANLSKLPLAVQKATQVGIALGQGKKIQEVALKTGAQLVSQNMKFPSAKSILGASKVGILRAAGASQALKNGSPVLKSALTSAASGIRNGTPESLGFTTAIKVLKATSGNQSALGAARRSLPTEAARRSFDHAVGTVAQTASRTPGMLKRAGAAFVPRMQAPLAKISAYQPNLAHAITSLQRNPTLMTQNPIVLANKFGTSAQTVMSAINRAGTQRLLPWRSLSPRATNFVRRFNPNANVGFLTHGTNDTAGLDESGTKYIVEKGDSPFKIALKLTGNGNRWVELKALNKDKKPDITKNVWVGEVLNIPPDWQKPVVKAGPSPVAVPSQPAPERPTGTVAPKPQISVAPGILQAKAILVAWSKSDGINQAGVSDYGSKAEDMSTDFGPRDKTQLMSFQNWSNKTGGAKLVVDGILGPKSLAALQSWAERRAAQAATTAATTIATLPETVITASPPVTQAPAVVVQSPGLPPVVISAPAAIPVAIPAALPPSVVASLPPVIAATPTVATPAQPATPATVAAASPSSGSKLGPAMAGAAIGGTLFGLPGAIIGGIAGAAIS